MSTETNDNTVAREKFWEAKVKEELEEEKRRQAKETTDRPTTPPKPKEPGR